MHRNIEKERDKRCTNLHLQRISELDPEVGLHVAGDPVAGHVGAGDEALLLRVDVVVGAQPRVLPLRVVARRVPCLHI